MKKNAKIFFVFSIFFYSMALFGENEKNPGGTNKFDAGIFFGPGFSKGVLESDKKKNFDEADISGSFSIGVYFNYYINNQVSIFYGLGDTNKPVKYTNEISSSTFPYNKQKKSYKSKNRYINLPFGMRFYGDILFYGIGIYYADKYIGKSGFEDDYGFFVDFGIRFDLDFLREETEKNKTTSKDMKLLLFIRYEKGLADIYSGTNPDFGKIKNTALYFNIGISNYF